MKKTKTIVVLATIINGRTNYVAAQMSNRAHDNKKVVNYCHDPIQAKEFGSEKEALAFIPKIVNPHERVFFSKKVTVPAQPTQQPASAKELV